MLTEIVSVCQNSSFSQLHDCVSAAAVVTTPQRRLDAGDVAEEHGGVREDVTTPAAARARASLVNSSYVPEVKSC